MRRWNVYEQKNGGLKLIGRTTGKDGRQALDQARADFRLRWPVVHELDDRGRELSGTD